MKITLPITIPLKTKVYAILIASLISLVATSGLFLAFSKLTKRLNSFNYIQPQKTLISLELFSPLIASIKNKKPITEINTVQSNIKSNIIKMSNNNLTENDLDFLLNQSEHIIFHFTADDNILIAINNKAIDTTNLKSSAFKYSKLLNKILIFSNNQETFNNLQEVKSDIAISLNDLAKIYLNKDIFSLSSSNQTINELKHILSPLNNKNENYNATIQQSNHKAKLIIFPENYKEKDQSNQSDLLKLIDNKNKISIYMTNNQSLNDLKSIININLISNLEESFQYLPQDSEKVFLFNNSDWLIGATNTNDDNLGLSASVLIGIYTSKRKSVTLPDKSNGVELINELPSKLIWSTTTPKLNWQLFNNKEFSLSFAKSNKLSLVGTSKQIYSTITNSTSYNQDCFVNNPNISIKLNTDNNKSIIFSQNDKNQIIVCLFY